MAFRQETSLNGEKHNTYEVAFGEILEILVLFSCLVPPRVRFGAQRVLARAIRSKPYT